MALVWRMESLPVAEYRVRSHISGCSPVGRARGLGPRSRGFKSLHSDHGFLQTIPSFRGFGFYSFFLRSPNICGCSLMAELQPSKLVMRVRFPSLAPRSIRSCFAFLKTSQAGSDIISFELGSSYFSEK